MLSSFRKCPRIENIRYATAKKLILSCGPARLCRAVKNLRGNGAKIGDISVNDLKYHLKDADKELLERLCDEFVYPS